MKRKNFLLQILTIIILMMVSFGVGKNTKTCQQEEELERHYQNWYSIGVFHTIQSVLDGNVEKNSTEIMELMEKEPSLEEEKELIEEILKDIPVSSFEDLPIL